MPQTTDWSCQAAQRGCLHMLQSCPDKWAASMVRCHSCAHCVPTLQVMKMLMPLLTPAAGRINFQLPEGAVLVSGDLIARLELDDSNAVTAAQPYPGGFPELGPPLVHSQGVDYRFKEAYSAAKMILEGGLHSSTCWTLQAASP